MIIKKFQAKTEADAIDAAKKAMGDNLVIMNVRKTKKKGIAGLFGKQITEVTVALEENQDRSFPLEKKAESRQQENRQQENRQRESRQQEILTAGKAGTEALEEKLDSLQSFLMQQMQKKEPSREDNDPDADIPENEEESKPKEPTEAERFMKLLYNTMLDHEVDEKYANQILEEAEKIQKPNLPFDYVLAGVYQKMILKFGQAEKIQDAGGGAKVIFFIGPTGVGKTTTIAKLASLYYVKEKKKVALLTADTYRIAAAEQLRTYANILKVPFRIIYTGDELKAAVQDFSEYDYIFIDTAGHGHANKEQRKNVEELVHAVDGLAESEIFLVLSATTKYKDLLHIADAYKEIGSYKLIFTKLDETEACGNLLNVRMHTNAPMSYVTYGQNVPDDIETFNPQKTVKLILGGKKS